VGGTGGDDRAHKTHRAALQNGTVKSNEELVNTLNAAEVPGTDVVGE